MRKKKVGRRRIVVWNRGSSIHFIIHFEYSTPFTSQANDNATYTKSARFMVISGQNYIFADVYVIFTVQHKKCPEGALISITNSY